MTAPFFLLLFLSCLLLRNVDSKAQREASIAKSPISSMTSSLPSRRKSMASRIGGRDAGTMPGTTGTAKKTLHIRTSAEIRARMNGRLKDAILDEANQLGTSLNYVNASAETPARMNGRLNDAIPDEAIISEQT